MLKGIHPCIGPELLKVLYEMGHGDELVLADVNFPGHALHAPHVLRADGVRTAQLLDAIMPLWELDTQADPLFMMAPVHGDTADAHIETDFMAAIHKHCPKAPAPLHLDRFDFYERAKGAYAIVMTGEPRKYGDIILKKGPITAA